MKNSTKKYSTNIKINIEIPMSKCDTTIGKHYATFLQKNKKWYKQ
jgi:hypothetical protein